VWVAFHRYVALGDSFTEGVGDPDPRRPNGVRGWADRVADVMASQSGEFGYANFAIRGRKLRAVLAEQIEPALALEPDLVTIYAGANDILRPSVDIDGLVADYDEALGRLVGAGAHLLMFTAFDPGGFPVFGAMRGRFAVYNELVREVAEHHDATLVDFWRLRDYRKPGMWADDRMHMSSAGHQRMAMAVLDALGVEHDLIPVDLPPAPPLTKKERRAANVDWVRAHAAPWVKRRLTGTSSGDSLDPRFPRLTRPHR
jgi:lysophospholipase L1-like esterase